jgi:uridine kinase
VHPRHLVGYGSLAPVDATFRIVQAINPRLATVGVAHNPSESNSRRFMELARASCKARGIVLLESQFGRQHPALAPLVDFQIWLDVPADVAFARRIAVSAR